MDTKDQRPCLPPQDYFEVLKTTLEEAAIPVHFVDGDGIILWANKAELRMLGFSSGEFIGKPISAFHEDQETVKDIRQRLLAGETLLEYPVRLCCKDGSIKHVLINSNGYWEGDEFLHSRCFTRDVTEQVRAEEAVFHLSTPVLEIEERLLLLPLVGMVNEQRAALISQTLLNEVKDHRALAVVLDLTGATDVDTYVLKVLVNLSKTCQGLGARVLLSGISPRLATRMVSMEVSLADVLPLGDLREAIREARRLIAG